MLPEPKVNSSVSRLCSSKINRSLLHIPVLLFLGSLLFLFVPELTLTDMIQRALESEREREKEEKTLSHTNRSLGVVMVLKKAIEIMNALASLTLGNGIGIECPSSVPPSPHISESALSFAFEGDRCLSLSLLSPHSGSHHPGEAFGNGLRF